jgi:hypothetical protein
MTQALPHNEFDYRNGAPMPHPSPVPQQGEPERDAINSLVDRIVLDNCKRLKELENRLEDIRKQILASAADTKATLNEHVTLSIRFKDEIERLSDVIEEIAARGRDE